LFDFRRVGTISTAAGWRFAAGDFTGDRVTDLSAYHSDGIVRAAMILPPGVAAAPPADGGGDGPPSPQEQCFIDAFLDYEACVLRSMNYYPEWPSIAESNLAMCADDYRLALRRCEGLIKR
jgi:hypothetical protein